MKRNKNSERRKKYKLIVKLSEKHSRNRRKKQDSRSSSARFQVWCWLAAARMSQVVLERSRNKERRVEAHNWRELSILLFSGSRLELQLVLHCSAFELISRSESMNVRKITTEHCRYHGTAPGRTSRKAHCAVAAELNLNWIITGKKLRESSSGTLLTSLNPPEKCLVCSNIISSKMSKVSEKMRYSSNCCLTRPLQTVRYDRGKICIFYETKKEKYPKTIDRYNLI